MHNAPQYGCHLQQDVESPERTFKFAVTPETFDTPSVEIPLKKSCFRVYRTFVLACCYNCSSSSLTPEKKIDTLGQPNIEALNKLGLPRCVNDMGESLEANDFQIIDADILIPGRGSPIFNGTLVYRSNRIVFVGHRDGLPTKYQTSKAIRVAVLMPGM